jgi:cyanophycin synthetase
MHRQPVMERKNDIRLLRTHYLRGPNLWTYRPALETWLDLGDLEDFPSNTLPGLNERLCAWLPALAEHHCGVGERGGFLQRLEEGTWCGHVLEHVVIELLNLAGMPTGFGQTRSTSMRGVYRMVFRARDEQVARTALAQGHRLLMCAINDEPFDVPAALTTVRETIDDCYLGPSTAAIVAAATDRRIPHIRLNEGNLVQLGHGRRQRRIWTAETDLTSAIAEGIAGEKDLTKRLLKAVGVPVPEGQLATSAAEAWEAAQDIGLPVVVKPTDGNHGRGVSLDLNTQAEVEAAWVLADQHGSEVLVERHVPGDEHRLLVVGGKVVAAARGEAAWVTGDGHSSVRQLIDSQLNTDPRRGTTEDFPLNRILIEEDDVVRADLQRLGLTPDSVPAAGRRVLIQRNGNVAIDCTDQVHPEVAHLVALAARTVGLDIAGVDLVVEDIGKPLQAQGGAVVEVNAGPGLLMHLRPAEGAPQPVGRAIVDHLFPDPEDSGRIPIVGVAGSRHTAQIARLVAWVMQLGGRHVGLACRDGLYLDRRQVEAGDCTHWDAGRRLLINRNVEAAVFENDAAAILRDGLAYDRCTVGIVTDLDGIEALADYDVHDADQMLKVLRTQVDVVLANGSAVLNADDERVAALGRLCDGSVLLYALDEATPALAAHRAAGGRVAFLRDGDCVLAEGATETLLPRLAPLSAQAVPLAPEDLLPAVAATWAMGIVADLITAGVQTFGPAPARVRSAQPHAVIDDRKAAD